MPLNSKESFKKVVIIGDLFLDILPSPLPIEKQRILEDGETFVSSVTFQRGGCAGNFAAVLCSLMKNDEIYFISKVGNDQNGEFLLKQLNSYGIKTKISTSTNLGTAITIAVSFNDGERHFVTYNGAMEDFKPEDIDLSLLKNVNHIVWRGIWFTPNLLFNAQLFLKPAKDLGISISMDLGFDPYWGNPELGDVKRRKTAALNCLQYIDYLFGNKKEFCNLTDTESLESAIEVLFQYKVKNILVHMGAEGAKIYRYSQKGPERKNPIMIPIFKSVSKINPVGTGDTHDAGFIFRILNGDSLEKSAIYGSAAAAYSLSQPAGTKITSELIDKFIR
jgi:sugar/nucleoside kinase (ribokinase family)